MRKHKGFSLIELLIVVAIILIIAAIAVPSLLRSRIIAAESAAASTVRTLNTAQATYQSTYPSVGYAAVVGDLGGGGSCTPGPTSACLVDDLIAGGKKGGYNYASKGTGGAGGGPNTDFATTANPQTPGISGNKDFCSTADMVIRTGPASSTTYTPSTCRNLGALQN